MLTVQHYSFQLAFEHPFTISKGTKTHQPTLIVSLGLRNWKGYGEACEIPYYGITVEKSIQDLESKLLPIQRYALIEPQRFWHMVHHLFEENSFLVAALDMAGWDLFSKMRNLPLRTLASIPPVDAPITDYTIGIDNMDNMVEKAKKHPWPLYKIKISHADDIQKLEALRKVTSSPFRLDANEALNFDDVLKLLPEYDKLGVHLIEQPLPKNEWDAMQELKSKSNIPLYADESCVSENDVLKCANSFHGINIKLSKCGGITPALRMVGEARKLNLGLMLGSMNESSVGTAAMVLLSPLFDHIDADGPLLLKQDIAEGLTYKDAKPQVLPSLGLGVRFMGQVVDRTL